MQYEQIAARGQIVSLSRSCFLDSVAILRQLLRVMLSDYLPVLFQMIIAIGFAAVVLTLSVVFGKSGRTNAIKDSAYECGMLPIGDGAPRFSVKFYLIAMLFVIFDIEVVFMYPWAVVFRDYVQQFGPTILWSMLSFVLILLFGYVYAIKKGALDWSR